MWKRWRTTSEGLFSTLGPPANGWGFDSEPVVILGGMDWIDFSPSPSLPIILYILPFLKSVCLCLAVADIHCFSTVPVPTLPYWLILGKLCWWLSPQYFERLPRMFEVLRIVTWLLKPGVSLCFTFNYVFVYSLHCLELAVLGAESSWADANSGRWDKRVVIQWHSTLPFTKLSVICSGIVCQTINYEGMRSQCICSSHLSREQHFGRGMRQWRGAQATISLEGH